MKILVTGAGGFIGSHVVETLVKQNHEVTALVHYNGAGTAGWLDSMDSEVKASVQVEFGDITDSEHMNRIIFDQESVVNLAALIAIPYSYVAPRSYVNTNVIGTLNICEAAKHSGSKLLQISTSEVYGTPDEVPIRETHALRPQSPYAATKVASDQLALSYHKSFDLPVTIIRPFNTFGPRQSMRAIIPTILGQLLSGDSTIKIGDLSPKRDFTYVGDTASAIAKALLIEDINGQVIHLGTGKTISVGELVNLCSLVAGVKVNFEVDNQRVRPAKSEVQILQSDPTKAKDMLGWVAETSLFDGIRSTFNWMQTNSTMLQDSSKYWR